jgi:hypothetical protein
MFTGVVLLCESVSPFKVELNLTVSVSAQSFYSSRPGKYIKTWG